MNFKTVKGNICDLPEGVNTIIHQANTQNIMASGVALALKNKWPQVEKADQLVHEYLQKNNLEDSALLSHFSKAKIPLIGAGELTVYNLYGQELRRPSDAGCATDYNAVVKGFERVVEAILDEEQANDEYAPIVGIPHLMGCDRAGGDWEIYEAIIRKSFRDLHIPVVFVDFNS